MLTSSPLRWFSIVTYVVLTMAIFNRDAARSGGNSVVGAIPNDEILYYTMGSVILIQCSAYAILCCKKLRTIITDKYCGTTSSKQVSDNETFSDNLEKRPKLNILYWSLGAISCSLSVINSLYLLSHNELSKQLFPSNNHTNLTHPSFNLSNLSSTNNTSNTTLDFISSDELAINELNRASVMGAVWAWNLCNIIEVTVFLLFRPTNDCDNARISTMYFLSNIFRTLVVSKVGEDVTYPGYIISKWASMPFKSCYLKLKPYICPTPPQQQQNQQDTPTTQSRAAIIPSS